MADKPFDIPLQQAMTLLEQGQTAQAEALLQVLAQQHPDQLQLRLYLAQVALKSGKGAAHIEVLQEVAASHPFIADGYFILGQCLQQAGRLPEAVSAFYHALQSRWSAHEQLEQAPALTLQEGTPTAETGQDGEIALRLLWQVLAQLRQAGMAAFPMAGSLLGLEREGKLLDNDVDVDIGVDWQQMSQVIALLKGQGWHEVDRSYDLINPRCLVHPSGVAMDLCGFATDEKTGGVISGLWMKGVPFHWNRITRFPAITLTARESPGGTISYPSVPEQILMAMYGEGWRQPDRHFDTIICAHNLQGFSWLTRCYAYARLYHCWTLNKAEKCQRLLQTLVEKQPTDTFLRRLLTHFTAQLTEPHRVLALGCFDMLHIGHMNYLRYARAQGSSLIVGVAPDAFCQRSKGYRPVQNEEERMAFIRTLEFVNEVMIVQQPMVSGEPAAAWINSLQVKTVVCGGEWQGSERWNRLEQLLGGYGIKVIYAPATPGVSSTLLKQRVKEQQ
ncbi:adenylyltransferase/cytidyltransferase family protein [Pokkaliibacter plantistimulans]|nr:adenylyltransferase/cytidyltransferase family protein [Pokkaliibacter plantistimulans]